MSTDMLGHLVDANPLTWPALTVLIYLAGCRLQRLAPRCAALQPILLSILTIVALLWALHVPYAHYFRDTAPIHLAMEPLFILLVVPLWRETSKISAARLPLTVALLTGSSMAILSGMLPPLRLASPAVAQTLADTLAFRSTTSAAAIGYVTAAGGAVGLTVAIVVLTGIVGAALGPWILRLGGVTDERAVGFALGLAANGLGTARAFAISQAAGSFASIGMILNTFATAGLSLAFFAMT
ncbi:LrgB family protein [Limimaricola sp.]|uniref:LrgB family protein n=1 Tax=Limimaricola sp. TaxID=2211665 RepID=UPI0025B831C8|nr:LrgB family protein [Limimaricola sp.]